MISIVIVLSFTGTVIRKNELSHAVNHALFTTMTEQFAGENVKYENETQLILAFEESLDFQLQSDGQVSIDILGSDAQKGMLSVRVKSGFVNPAGKERQVEVVRTVLREQYE